MKSKLFLSLMCTNINVNLPTVVSFLLLYSLRCGCIVILIWTVIRSLFLLCFFINAIISTFLPPPASNVYYMPKSLADFFYVAFVAQIMVIVTESFAFVFTIYLGMGLYYETPYRVNQYLVCRFCTWLSEFSCLVLLSITNYDLIGWYLVFLMFVILEFYGFIVVYSYYVDMIDDQRKQMERSSSMVGKNHVCEC